MNEVNEINAKYANVDLKKFKEIAEQYGFSNVLEFATWVEDNNLGEILFGKDQEDIEREEKELMEGKEIKVIDKDSIAYKSTILALDILSLPEVKRANLHNATTAQWLKWSRKARNKRKDDEKMKVEKMEEDEK